MNISILKSSKLGITLIIVVLIQLLMAFQGFDVCDDGWVLTFYQQIFSNPESVEYNFLYWFAGIVGGLWYKLFEDGGILWFRILAIIVNTSAFYLSYQLLKKYLNKDFLLLALTMVLFVNDYGFLTFYHNQLTALMAVIVVFILNKALRSDNRRLFIIAGFVLSFTVFVRIPNAVLHILIFAIPFAFFIADKKVSKSIQPALLFVSGSILGYLSIYLILLGLGQVEIMKNALLTIVDLGNTENSSHNFKEIFKAPLHNFLSIVQAFNDLIVLAFILYILNYIPLPRKILLAMTSIVAIGVFIFWFNTGNIYPVYSLCLFGSAVLMFKKSIPNEIRVISFMSLLILSTLWLGSAGGLKNSGYMAIWIGLPLFFYLMPKDFSIKGGDKSIYIHKYLYCLAFAFLILKAYKIPQQSYFDPGSRFEKTFAINNVKARGVYTTERRAQIMNELLLNLNRFVKPNEYLLAYDKIPMVHFLTETKPYMYNSWVWIYDYNSFEKKLLKAEQEIDELPVVVQQKIETIYEFSEPIEDYMSETKENTNFHSNERNATMNSFLKRNNYEVVWSNAYFNIYKSNLNQ
ncbi:hypothetical protein [Winogradskyella tangerina]|uniref:hypothetical protein n=1 Tax=Winogradskyella tangerina TaxID=2023240 RepID=UPI000DBE2A5E|nr:hypothetical protein [Winogradskyella tangerina]